MFIACDNDSNRISINDAIEGTDYYCPCCNEKLILKKGLVNQWHFAHKTKVNCDEWYEMSEWHKHWQEKFPIEYREIVIKGEYENHRADIKVGRLVIEFQKSPITIMEFKKRCDFYSSENDLVWLFDIRDKKEKPYKMKISRNIYKTDENNMFTYKWKYAYKLDLSCCIKSHIFFQVSDNKIIGFLESVDNGLSLFKGTDFTKDEFMDYLRLVYKQHQGGKRVFEISYYDAYEFARLNGYE